MKIHFKLFQIFLFPVLLSILMPQASAQPSTGNALSPKLSANDDLNIIGLRLGMTTDEVITILLTINEHFNVTRTKGYRVAGNEYISTIVASVGERYGKNTSTGENEIESPFGGGGIGAALAGALSQKGGERITIEFSEPPSNNVVNQISRDIYFSEGPSVKNISEALKNKYGANPNKDINTDLVWYFGDVPIDSSLCGAYSPEALAASSVYRTSSYKLAKGTRVPGDIEGCGLFVSSGISIGTANSVNSVVTVLVNTTAIDKQLEATDKYLTELEIQKISKLEEDADNRDSPKF